MHKDDCRVLFPERLSFLSAEVTVYDLVAVVVHVGDRHSEGHFVTFRRVPARASEAKAGAVDPEESKESEEAEAEALPVGRPPSEWICVSDEETSHVPLARVLASNPYLLFYERCV